MLTAMEQSGVTRIGWDPIPEATGYEVMRGRISNLAERGGIIDLGTVECLASISTGDSTRMATDSDAPPAGEAFFYLVSYDTPDSHGSVGSVSAGKPRVAASGGCTP